METVDFLLGGSSQDPFLDNKLLLKVTRTLNSLHFGRDERRKSDFDDGVWGENVG